MNAHSAALHPEQDTGLLGVSSVFSGTMAGLTALAGDGPALHHLDGIGMILEPQVVMVENLVARIHGKREIVPADYLDRSGEVAAACKRNVAYLHAFIVELGKGDELVELDRGIDTGQRHRLSAAYQRIITLSQRAIEALETLAGVVVTHDLDAEPPSAHAWDNLDDMLAALKAQPA